MKNAFAILLTLTSLLASAGTVLSASVTLIPRGAVWKYLDNGSNQGTAWRAPSFVDTSWAAGPAELGYGDGGEATVVSYGPSSSSKYITTYFRHSFQVTEVAAFTALTLGLLRDDGAVVYLNGVEVYRSNMPSGSIHYLTTASSAIEDNSYHQANVDPALLVEGQNVIAIEVHQANGTSTDLSLNFELFGSRLEQNIVLNAPAAGASDVILSPELNVTVSDFDGDNLNITFYGRVAGAAAQADVIATQNGVPSGTSVSTRWSGLSPNTEYEWYVVASDGSISTTGAQWRFTTGSGAPVPPMVTITDPPDNWLFSAPATISISASSDDVDGEVSSVEFYANGAKIGEDHTSPFNFVWNSVGAGAYALTAVATDDSGLAATSSIVNVSVIAGPVNNPPSVALTAPGDGSTYTAPADILISASASDGDGSIARVEFFRGTTKIGEALSVPYTMTWGQVAAGNYVLTAVATDNGGAQTTSPAVNVTVAPPNETAIIIRGPYLQRGTPTSVVLRWRTDVPTETRVRYGTDPENLNLQFANGANVTEHVALLAGLEPETKYFYEMGTALGWFAPDANDFFITSPPVGAERPTRIWLLGDSGTGDANAAGVRDGFLAFTGPRKADLLVMLGDNAYDNGTDADYQKAVFNMYPGVLQNTVVWPTIGNHDTAGSANPPSSLPYFNIFTLPQNGEAGGVASGTERYYSFDYANIHFICLDSMTSDRSVNGPMLTWLRNDLAATTQEWLIAFWHHPPYSRGSHNSDVDTQLIQMRANALPILEAAGVDLVFAGHSHSYERSFLLNGHYGLSSTFSQSMKVDGGSGRENTGDGAYEKPAGLAPNAGAVYTVAGASGKTSGGTLNHPAMFTSQNVLGSVVLDVNAHRVDAYYVGTGGVLRDYFTLLKAVPPSPIPAAPDGLIATALSSTEIALQWNDNSDNELGFVLERSTDGVSFNQFATVGANVVGGVDAERTPASTYYYRVLAFNDAGASAYSEIASATTSQPTLPPAPTGLAATPGDARVDLMWDSAPDTISYNVKRSQTTGGPYATIATDLPAPGFADQTVVNGETYYYVVSAVSLAGEGPDSAEVSATPQVPPPLAPAELVAVTGDAVVTLAWSPSANAAGYFLKRAESSGGPYAVIAGNLTGTNYNDTTVVNGVTYFYVVSAFNAGGESPDSIEATANPATTPGVPGDLAAASGDNLVFLTWSATANATSYRVKRSTTSGGTYSVIATVATTSYADSGVANGTTYFYVLSALNGSVESADSAEVSATPMAPPPPTAPAELSATAQSRTEILLTWQDTSSNESGFQIYQSLDGIDYALVDTTAPNVTSGLRTGLQPGTAYHYIVRAFNGSGFADSLPATATTAANQPPSAVADSYAVDEDNVLSVVAPGVLVNDSDADGDSLEVALVTGAANGALSLVADGGFIYTPVANFHGVDSFTYEARDVFGSAALATVTITVGSVNDAPTANPDVATTLEGSVVVISVLVNDTDAEGQPLSITAVTQGAMGSVTLNPDQTVSYQPNAGFTGQDTFTYTVSDSQATAIGTVTVTVRPNLLFSDGFESGNFTAGGWVVSGPVNVDAGASHAGNFGALLKKGSSISKSLLGIGPGTVNLTYARRTASLEAADFGRVEFSTDGQNWTPLENVTGTTAWETRSLEITLAAPDLHLRFRLNGSEGNDVFMVDEVTVSGGAANNAPAATADSYTVEEDTVLSVAAPGVLGNDSDPDGNPIVAVLVSGPSHGTLSLSADGAFIYTPAANFNGTDTFTYKANDGRADSAPATVNITISPVNDAPVAGFTSRASGLTVDFTDISTDVDGTIVSRVWTFDDGATSSSENPTRVYAAGGTYTVTLTVTDDRGATDTASAEVSVQETAGTVVVSSISYSTSGGRAGNNHIAVTIRLRDSLGNPVAGASVSAIITNGTQSMSRSGTTDSAGSVTFQQWNNAPSGTYTTTVTEVVAAGLTWDGVTPPNSFTK